MHCISTIHLPLLYRPPSGARPALVPPADPGIQEEENAVATLFLSLERMPFLLACSSSSGGTNGLLPSGRTEAGRLLAALPLLLHSPSNSGHNALNQKSRLEFPSFFLFEISPLFLNFYWFFGCTGSSLLFLGLSLVPGSRDYSSLWCSGFSLRKLFLSQSMGSGEHRLQ